MTARTVFAVIKAMCINVRIMCLNLEAGGRASSAVGVVAVDRLLEKVGHEGAQLSTRALPADLATVFRVRGRFRCQLIPRSMEWDTRPKKPWDIIERSGVPLSRNLLTALAWYSPLGSANDFNYLRL